MIVQLGWIQIQKLVLKGVSKKCYQNCVRFIGDFLLTGSNIYIKPFFQQNFHILHACTWQNASIISVFATYWKCMSTSVHRIRKLYKSSLNETHVSLTLLPLKHWSLVVFRLKLILKLLFLMIWAVHVPYDVWRHNENKFDKDGFIFWWNNVCWMCTCTWMYGEDIWYLSIIYVCVWISVETSHDLWNEIMEF